MAPNGICLLLHLLVHSSHSKPDTIVHVYVPPEKGGNVLFCCVETWIFSLNGSSVFPISLGGAPRGGLLNQGSGGDFGHDYQEEGWFHLSWVSIKSSSFATQSSSPLHRHAFPLGEEMKAETHNSQVVDVSRILDPDNEFGCGLSSAR